MSAAAALLAIRGEPTIHNPSGGPDQVDEKFERKKRMKPIQPWSLQLPINEPEKEKL